MPRNDYEIIVHMKMLDEGIVPYGIVPSAIVSQLKEMPDQDRRKMKRKFRKLWRKAYKKFNIPVEKISNKPPSKAEMSKRLCMVYHSFREDALNHMKVCADEHI